METLQETSYGIIPLQFVEGQWQVLLLQHKTGAYWGFPKGHTELNELPRETACRELREETGLEVKRFLREETLTEQYQFIAQRGFVSKTVMYFIAEAGGILKTQANEIMDAKWVPLKDVSNVLTFPDSRELFEKFLVIWNADPSVPG